MAAVLRVVMTGAVMAGGGQPDALRSLGGLRAWNPVQSLTWLRANALAGVQVVGVSGANGKGIATLAAIDAGSLSWTPPGGTAGLAVAVGVGETVRLYGGGAGGGSCWVEVYRWGSATLQGSESVQLLDTLNGWLGGSNFSAAETAAGAEKYLAAIVENVGDATATGVKVWIDATAGPMALRIASEALSGEGVQSIADEGTSPTGLTWVAPTSAGSALSLGTLAVGARVGLWRETSVEADAPGAALVTGALVLQWQSGAETVQEILRGAHRVENADTAQWEAYATAGRAPVPVDFGGEDEPVLTGTSLPLSGAVDLADGDYQVALYRRNAWGLLGACDRTVSLPVVDGEAGGERPLGPAVQALVSASAGSVRARARYLPMGEGVTRESVRSKRATHWLIYWAVDEDPDPGTDTPIVVPMRGGIDGIGAEYLDEALPAQLDQAPLRAIVRTRRVTVIPGEGEDPPTTVTVDSANTGISTATAERLGPRRPRGSMAFGRARGQATAGATAPSLEQEIDAEAEVRWVLGAGSTALLVGEETVVQATWDRAVVGGRVIELGAGWNLWTVTHAEAATMDGGGLELGQWDESVQEIWVVVRGLRVVRIDVLNKVIEAAYTAVEDLPAVPAPGATHARWGDTLVSVWDPSDEDWIPFWRVTRDGGLRMAVGPWLS